MIKAIRNLVIEIFCLLFGKIHFYMKGIIAHPLRKNRIDIAA